MSEFGKELMFLILQFLEEEHFEETKIKLEQEWGLYFNMRYFEEKVLAGEWSDLDKYLSVFTKIGNNKNSTKIFFEIRKQKYLEALDRQNKVEALDILVNDLRVFKMEREDLYNELTDLLTLGNFRENEHLSRYGDMQIARTRILIGLKKLIRANADLREKLEFPSFSSYRLRELINQSLNCQHHLCNNPGSNPQVQTLFTDHTCNTRYRNVAPFNVPATAASYPVGLCRTGGHANDIDSSIKKSTTLDSSQWHLTEILDHTQCCMVTLSGSDDDAFSKVVQLLYTNSDTGILALGSDGVQKLWKWPCDQSNPSGKVTTRIIPPIWYAKRRGVMTNDTSGIDLEVAISCIALLKNDYYVVSAIGGKITLFNMLTFSAMTTFMPPPPKASFLVFDPRNNNVIAVGMEDSTIHIYNVMLNEVQSILRGHKERISSLTFSDNLNVLVSSSVDAQLCFWSIDTWEMRKSIMVELPTKTSNGDTHVQSHLDQVTLLVTQATQLALYDGSKYERIRQWVPQETLSARICCASYSSDSRLVFASFCDGNIGIFDADSLRLRCRIAPSAYMSPTISNESQDVYPLVIVANPQEPNQFAVGLTDGSIKVIEPLESEEQRGVTPPVPTDNGLLNSTTGVSNDVVNTSPDQVEDTPELPVASENDDPEVGHT